LRSSRWRLGEKKGRVVLRACERKGQVGRELRIDTKCRVASSCCKGYAHAERASLQ
jgi:hypothetical protein